MNIKLDKFFENPSWEGVVAILLITVATLIIIYWRKEWQKEAKKTEDKRRKYSATLAKLSAQVSVLSEPDKNTLGIQSTDRILTAVFRTAENALKSEMFRIFKENHRQESKRQEVIKRVVENVTVNTYDNCKNTLKQLNYKTENLSEAMGYFEIKELREGVLKHVFDKGESDMQDIKDTFDFLETFFTAIITSSKSYYLNI